MEIESKVRLHFIVDNVLTYVQTVNHVPRVGDEVRFLGEKYYTVTMVVWVYDEPEAPWGRANVGLESIKI